MEDVGLAKETLWGRHFSQLDAAFGAERHFRLLVVRAGHPRNAYARWRAKFFCRSTI